MFYFGVPIHLCRGTPFNSISFKIIMVFCSRMPDSCSSPRANFLYCSHPIKRIWCFERDHEHPQPISRSGKNAYVICIWHSHLRYSTTAANCSRTALKLGLQGSYAIDTWIMLSTVVLQCKRTWETPMLCTPICPRCPAIPAVTVGTDFVAYSILILLATATEYCISSYVIYAPSMYV